MYRLAHFLNGKYAKEKPDLVITILPPALECLKMHYRDLLEGVPVVAAVLPRDTAESLAASPLRKRATGIIYADNAYEIAKSALILRPGTKHVAFVSGASPIDISFKVPILREIKRAIGGMDMIDLSALAMGETLSRVHTLPPGTIVFHTSIFMDKNGTVFNPPDAHRMVSDASNAPVFGFVESHMGKGIVGGKLSILEWHIGKIAELTLRILNGEFPSTIPIVEEPGYRSVYDWRELKRWKIPESSLPKGSILINKERNVFERYKLYIVAILLFLVLQTVLIGFLVRSYRVLKKTSSRLRESEDRYRELLRIDRSSRLGELTASLAHELNQPLTAILSTAQAGIRFMESGKNDPALYREILQNIIQDVKRAANVIRSLRLMIKKEPTRKDKVNLVEVLSEVLDITNSELVKHNISIEALIDVVQSMILADKGQIQQVVLNLILNAVDAVTHNAHDKRKIVLQTENSNGFVQVSVHDNGPGIPAEDLERVFDPFFTRKNTGIGIGLAVCKTIITEHKGRIWARNNSEGGATFSFEIKEAANG